MEGMGLISNLLHIYEIESVEWLCTLAIVAVFDAKLAQEILELAERQRERDLEHHRKPDDSETRNVWLSRNTVGPTLTAEVKFFGQHPIAIK